MEKEQNLPDVTDYATLLRLRIDWSEMDLFGHVNNVMFMKYVQAARVNYWENTGLTGLFESGQVGPMLAETGCRFLKPLHYPGNVEIRTKCISMGNTSFVLLHMLINDSGELAAIARDVVVVYNFSTNTKTAIPEQVRGAMKALEKQM